MRAWHVRWCAVGALLLAVAPRPVRAQQRDSARAGAQRADTLRPAPRRAPSSIPDSLITPPITPRSAFLRSLLLPGAGQTALRRPIAATLFGASETGIVYMLLKSRTDLARAHRQNRDSVTVTVGTAAAPRDSAVPVAPQALVNARRLHLEDWIAAILTNHVLAGVDAYVAAHLWDLPARVTLEAMPRGATLSARVRW
jgi:hypothetical protein